MYGFVVTTHYNNYELIHKCLTLLFDNIVLKESYIVLFVNETTCSKVLNIKQEFINKYNDKNSENSENSKNSKNNENDKNSESDIIKFETIYIDDQKKNGGLTGTWNQGIDYLLNIPFFDCKVITILGHDTFVNENIKYLLQSALEAENNKDLKYFGPLFKNYSGKDDELWQDELHYKDYNKEYFKEFFLIGSIFTFPVNSLIKNKLNIDMYFNSKTYPFGYNDIDWYKRFLKIGGQAVIIKDCIIDHQYKRTWYIKK